MSRSVSITNSNINIVNGNQENITFIYMPVTFNMIAAQRYDEPHKGRKGVGQGLIGMYRRWVLRDLLQQSLRDRDYSRWMARFTRRGRIRRGVDDTEISKCLTGNREYRLNIVQLCRALVKHRWSFLECQ